MKKQNYHHGSLKQELLRVGRSRLEERGLEQLSLREVAKELGVTAAAPYRHFADREALLDELAYVGWKDLRSRLESAGSLAEQFTVYREFTYANRQLIQLMVGRCPAAEMEMAILQESTVALNLLMQKLSLLLPKESTIKHTTKSAILAWSLIHGLSLIASDKCMEEMFANVGPSDSEIAEFFRLGLAFWRE